MNTPKPPKIAFPANLTPGFKTRWVLCSQNIFGPARLRRAGPNLISADTARLGDAGGEKVLAALTPPPSGFRKLLVVSRQVFFYTNYQKLLMLLFRSQFHQVWHREDRQTRSGTRMFHWAGLYVGGGTITSARPEAWGGGVNKKNNMVSVNHTNKD